MQKNILYLKFNTESSEELLDCILNDVKNKQKSVVFTPNLDFFRLSYKNLELRDTLNQATYSTVDGKPVLWMAKWLKIKDFKYKISGSDLSIQVLEKMGKEKLSLFLFGGLNGVSEIAAQKVKEKYPGIKIAGTLEPQMGYVKNDELCHQYIKKINEAKPDVVFLCTGAPRTEQFYMKYKDEFGPACYFSVGATIDFIAGTVKRAPKWMSNIGLEWFYRLTKDFRRLFKRYWLDGWFLIKIWFITHFHKSKINRM